MDCKRLWTEYIELCHVLYDYDCKLNDARNIEGYWYYVKDEREDIKISRERILKVMRELLYRIQSMEYVENIKKYNPILNDIQKDIDVEEKNWNGDMSECGPLICVKFDKLILLERYKKNIINLNKFVMYQLLY